MKEEYSNFREFYPSYLDDHRDPACRRLHFAGSAVVLLVLAAAAVTRDWRWLIGVPRLDSSIDDGRLAIAD